MAHVVQVLVACGLTVAGAYSPADGLRELNAVEQALHQIESAKLTPEQKRVSLKAVHDVEATVAQLKSNTTMGKTQRMQKVRAAIKEMEGLQSQWQLSAVATTLEKLEKLPRLSVKQRDAAKKVVQDVEATVAAIESGKLTGAAQHEKVGIAVKELTALQQDWLNATMALGERELAMKKEMLKKAEMELKLVKLEKELGEKKLMLKKLTAQKDQASDLEKERKEDAAEQTMVAKLLATAKALAGRKPAQKHTQAVNAKTAPAVPKFNATNSPLADILTDLKAREKNASDGIARLDAEEKKKEARFDEMIKANAKVPAAGQTAATKKSAAMMKMLVKQAHREYLKMRAAKVLVRKNLEDGVHSVETGDVAGLTKLMGKMQRETKSADAHSKNFLY